MRDSGPATSIPATEAESVHATDVVPGLPPPENKRFYPALDGLRAIAVLMVFSAHYFPDFFQRFPSLNWGWTGVDIFFVLSGFLITGILYDTRESAHRLRNFYARRTLRIFPLYYGILLLTLLLTPVFHWIWHPVLLLFPVYLSNFGRYLWIDDFYRFPGLLDNILSSRDFHPPLSLYFGHFWTLCVEEQFYLLWPFVVYWVKDRVKLRNICLLVWVLVPLIRFACVKLVPAPYIDAYLISRILPFRMDSLLLGGALALMLRGPETELISRIRERALWALIAIITLGELGWRFTHGHLFSLPGAGMLDPFFFSFVDLAAAVVILNILYPGSILFRLLNTTMLSKLGQISYGFYVFHDIPHVFYIYIALWLRQRFHWLDPVATVAFIGFTTTLLLALLSFRYFEAPFLRLKDRFTV